MLAIASLKAGVTLLGASAAMAAGPNESAVRHAARMSKRQRMISNSVKRVSVTRAGREKGRITLSLIRPTSPLHPVHGADLVAVGVAQISDIEFHAGAFANARRVFAGLTAVGEARCVPGVDLLR